MIVTFLTKNVNFLMTEMMHTFTVLVREHGKCWPAYPTIPSLLPYTVSTKQKSLAANRRTFSLCSGGACFLSAAGCEWVEAWPQYVKLAQVCKETALVPQPCYLIVYANLEKVLQYYI